jgi:hypothetical protein
MRKHNLSKTQIDLSNRLKDRYNEAAKTRYKDNNAQKSFWDDFENERATKRKHHREV